MKEAEENVNEQKWNETEGLFFQKFKINDNKGADCSSSQYPRHVNQWFNITFDKDQNIISGDGYLAATFIENNCSKKMNLRFKKFNIPPLIYNVNGQMYESNDEMCKMQPGRNFLAIKEIKFDNSADELGKMEKYKKALTSLKKSFNVNEISEKTAICVQGQAQELFYGSDKETSPDGLIIMTYVDNYSAFEKLERNKNISVAAMMDKAGFENGVYKMTLFTNFNQLEIPLRRVHGL